MKKTIAFAAVALLLCPLILSAATKDEEARRQHIHELLELIGVQRTMRAGFHAMVEQSRQQMLSRFDAADPDADADTAQQAAAWKKEVNEYLDRYEEIFFQKLDVKMIEDKVYIPLYEKYFTDEEVQQLVAFYKSPVGKKSIDTLPQVMQESVAMSTEIVQPVIADTMEALKKEQETKFPWRRTMKDMRAMATAIEAYSTDTDQYPADTDFAHLKATLSPTYILNLPEKDAWGNPYEVIVSADHQHYRIISAGADGVIEWDSRTLKTDEDGKKVQPKITDSIDDDIIYQDGSFLQYPKVSDMPGLDLSH